MHEKLKNKLNSYKKKLMAVDEFAKLLPLFENKIISEELVADQYCKLGDRHKNMYFHWDINWCPNRPINLPKEVTEHEKTVCVYINCLTIFHDDLYYYAQDKLFDRMRTVPCYWFDTLNTTFYFLPEQVETGLNALVEWYGDVREHSDEFLKKKKKEELLQALEELEK
jgi:hypothetical protein